MADLPPYPDSRDDTGNDTGARSGRGSAPSTPRWVKVFGIAAVIVLVVLFVIQHLAGVGMGGHAP